MLRSTGHQNSGQRTCPESVDPESLAGKGAELLFPWIKRADLIEVPQQTGGWIVKDPLTLQYSFLNDTEYAILNLLDGRRTVDAVLQHLQRLSPEQPYRPDELAQFIRELKGQQLIQPTSQSMSRPQPATAARCGGAILKLAFHVLKIRIPLLNPSWILDRILPWLSRLPGRWVLHVVVAVMLLAGLVLSLQFAELNRQLPGMQQFLDADNLMVLLLIFVVVKILHEAGHALTARYFGAECHECGVMLMLMTPVLYTNVSDAWMLPRHQRMLITAAGILVELVIAAVCLLLWSIAEPGDTRALLLNTVLLCSVNTLLFNGNPLLKFDGYFLLADFLRIPNLAARSAAAVQEFFIRLIIGTRFHPPQPHSSHGILLMYGILASAYRVVLTIAIAHVIDQMADRWNQRVFGGLLTLAIVFGFLVLPAARFVWVVLTTAMTYGTSGGDFAEGRVDRVLSDSQPPLDVPSLEPSLRSYVWLRILVAGSLLAGAMLWPLPRSVVVPVIVQPSSAALYATLPGRLVDTATYGQTVNAGMPIVTLFSPELERQQQQLEARQQSVQRQLELLLRNPVTANSELIPGLRESLRAAEEQLGAYRREAQQLVLRSPTDGVFLPPPAVNSPQDPDLPEFWRGIPARTRNLGAWIPRGTLLGYIGQSTDVVLLAYVPEDDVDLLQAGQKAVFLSDSGAAQVQSATVTEVSSMEAQRLPEHLGVAGLVSGQMTEAGMIPVNSVWLATIRLKAGQDQPPAPLYGTGHVRIQVASASVSARIHRYLRQAF